MTNTRTGKKVLSLLLTLCMVLSLLPAMGVTAGAMSYNSWVGDEGFNYTDATASGDGWTWAGASKVLTLSGVNASMSGEDAIYIAAGVDGAATVVLEGANKATAAAGYSGLYCSGALTIKGSGTLEVTGSGENSTGVYSNGDMKIESGYITVNGMDWGIKSDQYFRIYGGYVSAMVSGVNGIAVKASNYCQYGGYVKAVGSVAGVNSGVEVNGGYLEAGDISNSTYGIRGAASNAGGVIKAAGTTNGFNAICSSSGGVTIAKGGVRGIGASASLTSEYYWELDTNGVPVGTGSTPDWGQITHKYVVIAKEIEYTSGDLDGHYLCYENSGLSTGAALTVTGGSYIESGSGAAFSPNTLTVNGTLVCVTNGEDSGVHAPTGLAIGSDGTLVGSSASGVGVSAGTLTSSGDLIGLTNTGTSAVAASTLTVSDGCVCGINTALDVGSGVHTAAALSVGNGYVTAVSKVIGLDAAGTTQVSGGAVTAIGGSAAYSGAAVTDLVTGAAAENSPLTAVSFDANTYKVGEAAATVVCVKPLASPKGIFHDGFGATIANADVLAYVSGTTTHATKGYIFAGWYADADYSGAEVTSAYAAATDYYAKWTNNGNTVRLTALDFTNESYQTGAAESPAGTWTKGAEGWTWFTAAAGDGTGTTADNHPANTLILNGLRLETLDTAIFALKVPNAVTVVVNGANTIGASYGSGITANGSATFTGGGTLEVIGKATGITANGGGLTFNGSGTVNATATTGEGINAISGVTVSNGTVSASGATSGIRANTYTQTGGTVTATSTGSKGITALNTITISGGTVTATGGSAAFNKAPDFGEGFKYTITAGEAAEGATDVTNTPDLDLTDYPYVKIAPYVAPPSGGGSSTPKVPVLVDGKKYNIGTVKTSGGVTTVTVNQTALQKQLDAASETLVIPVTPGRNADAVVAKFVVANVDEMAEKEMTLSVQVDNVSYDMPAVAVDTKTLMAELGASDPAEVPINVTIKELDEEDVALEEGELILPPVEFTVDASYGGESVEVEVFEKYVQRVIEVPESIDAGKITTAVVVENGKQRHVPTDIFSSGVKWYARINSLTNSVYALINNEVGFADAEGKWFEAVVTEMASRGIIDGRDENTFDGDADITRAEFAAVLVRALGLPANGDASAFTDVDEGAWYCGAVGKAYEYGLVGGRGRGIFDPNAGITREEAMQMLCNVSAIAPIRLLSGINPGLYTDLDAVSDWAKDAASFSLLNGIVKGDNNRIRPLDNITRAESATMILRLLQKSGLVNVSTTAIP